MTNTATIPDPQFATLDGFRVRYADSGSGPERTILLTSPWPESLYAFAPVWPMLEPYARLVALDLPGFGRSEGSVDLMSPRAMGDFLTRFVSESGLVRPYVVAPDVGTAAALFAAASSPKRFSGLVVGGGATSIPLRLGEPLASWVLDPDLDRYRAVDPRLVVNTAVDNHAGSVPDDIRSDYLASYDGDRFVESMRYVRRYPEELPVLAGLLPDLRVPVTVVSGRHDHVVPLENATFVADRVPEGRSVVLEAGHFVWEEVPEQYAATVLDVLN
jgi:pimeloyl-ACP methyl ester carboxylesterase